MKKFFAGASSAIALGLLIIPGLTFAQAHGRTQAHPQFQARPGGAQWHGDIRQFHTRDMGYWRTGRWHHGEYGGRIGWWWIVGPSWYYYASPVYPYPDPYVPYTVYGYPPRNVYYCPNPVGYYPYLSYCNVGWQLVPMPRP